MGAHIEKFINRLLDFWEVKLMVASIAGLVVHQAFLFCAFAILVWLDCMTRWVAIAYDYSGKEGIWTAIKSIPAAHRARAISSTAMRRGLSDKMINYIILVIGALLADYEAGTPVFVNLIISYLSATEFLSIVENLNDAGISALSGLIRIIKTRTVLNMPPERRPGGKEGHKDDE